MKNLKSEILYKAGLKEREEMIEESSNVDKTIRIEEIKNRLSTAFTTLMREIIFSRQDVAYRVGYPNYGETPQDDNELKNIIFETIKDKMNKLNKVIEETFGANKEKSTTETGETKESGNSEEH